MKALTVDSRSENSASRPSWLRARSSSSAVIMPSLFSSNKSNMRRRRRVLRLGLRSLNDDDDLFLLRLRMRGDGAMASAPKDAAASVAFPISLSLSIFAKKKTLSFLEVGCANCNGGKERE
ncbi:hypothetical protein PanWU01x14_242120 [Parasponia andersonii]|uniref:Uncharacterized protein n=1 Tax=Parasponia andersonii TaxID=3476 RepID=A0A2P5BG10_PARAD|nr:hypothetical protein PanWU01x14_242120 [Parasponia andersonii]